MFGSVVDPPFFLPIGVVIRVFLALNSPGNSLFFYIFFHCHPLLT